MNDRPWWSWAAIGGAVGGVVSLFLPWRVVLAFGRVELSGIEIDDGRFAAGCLAIATFLLFPLIQKVEPVDNTRAVGAMRASGAMAAIAGYHGFNLAVEQSNEFADLHRAGAGAWLALAAGVALLAAAIGGRAPAPTEPQPF
ncbi:MAG: hypothetical protein U5K29_04190 [Acidimicrobiales bacterium]|nr:hypothetical protein [Acidimicrobiales bacterium]